MNDDNTNGLMTDDARETSRLLCDAELAILDAMNRLPIGDHEPRFKMFLAISALLSVAGRLMGDALAARPDDLDMCVELLDHVRRGIQRDAAMANPAHTSERTH